VHRVWSISIIRETIERFGKEVIPEIKRSTPESPLP
jgi:hypothetical protein